MIGVFLTAALCVAQTDLCAPAGSKMGEMPVGGGQITIIPATVMTALGAQFRAGAGLVVSLQPWSDAHGHGAIVQVEGELEREAVISGARVSGRVSIRQKQGTRDPVELIAGRDFRLGQLALPGVGTVDVGPGVTVSGGYTYDGLVVTIESASAIRAAGLEFAAGRVELRRSTADVTVDGTLARPQQVTGVLLRGRVRGSLKHLKLEEATLADPTELEVLELVPGEAPSGTRVVMQGGRTQLVTSSPITVCGIAIVATATPPPGQPSVTFEPNSGAHHETVVYGALAGSVDLAVHGTAHVAGAIALRYTPGTCSLVGVDAMLSAPSEISGLHFATKTRLYIADAGDERSVSGTLAQPEVVAGLTIKNIVTVVEEKDGTRHITFATLAKPGPFEEWQVPAGTEIQQSTDGWSFTTSGGRHARMLAEHRGERIDNVLTARSDADATTFTLSTPHLLKGTALAFSSFAIEHASNCVLGQLRTTRRVGMFALRKGANVSVCSRTIVGVVATDPAPSLPVGRWFVTEAVAGAKDAPPLDTAGWDPPVVDPGPVAGYWLQINSLCQGASGIPRPPPPRRWIWVDPDGRAASEADRNELVVAASRPGRACPVTRCCVP